MYSLWYKYEIPSWYLVPGTCWYCYLQKTTEVVFTYLVRSTPKFQVLLPLFWGTLGVQKTTHSGSHSGLTTHFFVSADNTRWNLKKHSRKIRKSHLYETYTKGGFCFKICRIHKQPKHNMFAKPSPSDDAHHNITSRASTLK